jgi:hypothetical protein
VTVALFLALERLAAAGAAIAPECGFGAGVSREMSVTIISVLYRFWPDCCASPKFYPETK